MVKHLHAIEIEAWIRVNWDNIGTNYILFISADVNQHVIVLSIYTAAILNHKIQLMLEDIKNLTSMSLSSGAY